MSSATVHVVGETSIETCAVRMDHLRVRHLLVVDGHGHLAGVVTDAMIQRHGTMLGREFVAYGLDDGATASAVAVEVDVVVHPDDDLLIVLRRLVRTRQDFAAVVDEAGHLVGLVTEHDLLKVALLVLPDTLRVQHTQVRPLITVHHADLASRALDVMVQNQIRHLPVTADEGSVLGVVSYQDLMGEDVRRRPVAVDHVRSSRLITAHPGDSIVSCAARMLERRIGCLPVLEGGRAIGIVTRRDIMDAAAAALEQESGEARVDPDPSSHREP